MLSTQTVFVLGAGASIPYGFPSGPALRHEICTETLMPGDPRHQILMDMGHSYADVEACRIAIARSWASSIDMFIATRADHADIAKAAIALTIARYERDNELFFADPKGDWFRYLWRLIHTPNDAGFVDRKVSFITFNYDRMLEHALANAIRHARRQDKVSYSMLPRIVHVYGSLGAYACLDNSGYTREFGERSTPNNITKSRETIQVISDGKPDGPLPLAAHDLLKGADRIVFLGFGYDEDNLRILRMAGNKLDLSNECRIIGTSMSLNHQERNLVRKLIPSIGLTEDNADCLQFLRQYQSFIA